MKINCFIDNNDQPSSWSVRLEAQGGKLMVYLFWNDTSIATHRACVPLAEFQDAVKLLGTQKPGATPWSTKPST